jgi:hypothetical protein
MPRGRHHLYRHARPAPGQEHRRGALDHVIGDTLRSTPVCRSRLHLSFPRRRESSLYPSFPPEPFSSRRGVLSAQAGIQSPILVYEMLEARSG